MRAVATLVLLFLGASLGVFLGACAQVEKQHNYHIAEGSREIKVGVTDKATVEAMMGPPQRKTGRLPEEVWIYARTENSATDRMLGMPLIGNALVAPFASESAYMTVIFNRGIVRSCKIFVNERDAAGTTRTYECGSE
jgi:hypothetical protein